MVVVVIVDKVIFQERDRSAEINRTRKSVSIYRYIEERGKQYCDV
jgi:hypothetical protein